MTREEKLRMLLHPEKYTEEQLDQMLNDDSIPTPGAEEEWQRFERKELRAKRRTSPLRKIAAMFIGTLLLSGITYAAIHLWKNANSTPSETPSQPTTVSPVENDTIAPAFKECPDSVSKSMSPIVYEDTELSTMLNDIAAHYQYEVIYQNENSKHVRLYFTWDKTAPIEDVIGTFNKFERIHITQENRQLIVK
jgi:hypothetical protein